MLSFNLFVDVAEIELDRNSWFQLRWSQAAWRL